MHENQPTKELIDGITKLDGKDQVKIAEWFKVQLDIIKTTEDAEVFNNPDMELTKWINWVTRASS